MLAEPSFTCFEVAWLFVILLLVTPSLPNSFLFIFQGIDFLRIGRCEAVHKEIQGHCLSGFYPTNYCYYLPGPIQFQQLHVKKFFDRYGHS